MAMAAVVMVGLAVPRVEPKSDINYGQPTHPSETQSTTQGMNKPLQKCSLGVFTQFRRMLDTLALTAKSDTEKERKEARGCSILSVLSEAPTLSVHHLLPLAPITVEISLTPLLSQEWNAWHASNGVENRIYLFSGRIGCLKWGWRPGGQQGMEYWTVDREEAEVWKLNKINSNRFHLWWCREDGGGQIVESVGGSNVHRGYNCLRLGRSFVWLQMYMEVMRLRVENDRPQPPPPKATGECVWPPICRRPLYGNNKIWKTSANGNPTDAEAAAKEEVVITLLCSV